MNAKPLAALLLTLASAAPLAAQTRRPAPPPAARRSTAASEPSISFRPFVMFSEEQFAAKTTFDAIFDQSLQPLWGGGVQIAFRNGFFAEVGASRFKQTGERAFLFNDQTFRLGIPLTVTLTPLEVTGGYRFHLRSIPRLRPYVGAGVGSYGYKEESPFSDATTDNVDVRHTGFLVTGGAEIRLHRWFGVALDAQYTRIPGILGDGGISKDAAETDLGGIAARFKLIVGR